MCVLKDLCMSMGVCVGVWVCVCVCVRDYVNAKPWEGERLSIR